MGCQGSTTAKKQQVHPLEQHFQDVGCQGNAATELKKRVRRKEFARFEAMLDQFSQELDATESNSSNSYDSNSTDSVSTTDSRSNIEDPIPQQIHVNRDKLQKSKVAANIQVLQSDNVGSKAHTRGMACLAQALLEQDVEPYLAQYNQKVASSSKAVSKVGSDRKNGCYMDTSQYSNRLESNAKSLSKTSSLNSNTSTSSGNSSAGLEPRHGCYLEDYTQRLKSSASPDSMVSLADMVTTSSERQHGRFLDEYTRKVRAKAPVRAAMVLHEPKHGCYMDRQMQHES